MTEVNLYQLFQAVGELREGQRRAEMAADRAIEQLNNHEAREERNHIESIQAIAGLAEIGKRLEGVEMIAEDYRTMKHRGWGMLLGVALTSGTLGAGFGTTIWHFLSGR